MRENLKELLSIIDKVDMLYEQLKIICVTTDIIKLGDYSINALNCIMDLYNFRKEILKKGDNNG